MRSPPPPPEAEAAAAAAASASSPSLASSPSPSPSPSPSRRTHHGEGPSFRRRGAPAKRIRAGSAAGVPRPGGAVPVASSFPESGSFTCYERGLFFPRKQTEREHEGAGWPGLQSCPSAALKQACVKKSGARPWAYGKSFVAVKL